MPFGDMIAPVGPIEGGPSLPRTGRNQPRRGAPPAGFLFAEVKVGRQALTKTGWPAISFEIG
jgi:hypothetical protein